MTQLALELDARDYGMETAAERNPDWLELFREIALQLYNDIYIDCPISIDDVREEAERRGYTMPANCQWMGQVFRRKSDGWRYYDSVPARHAGSHARRVSRWVR